MIILLGGPIGTLLAICFAAYLVGILLVRLTLNMGFAFSDVFREWKDVWLYEKQNPKPLIKFLNFIITFFIVVLIASFLESNLKFFSGIYMTLSDPKFSTSDIVFTIVLPSILILIIVMIVQLCILAIKKSIYKDKIIEMKNSINAESNVNSKNIKRNKFKYIISILAILGLILIPTALSKYRDEATINNAVYKDRLESVEVLKIDNDALKPGKVKVTFKVEGEGEFSFSNIADVSSITNPVQYKDGLWSQITKGTNNDYTFEMENLTSGKYELIINGYAYDKKKLSPDLHEKLKNEITFPVKAQFEVSNSYKTMEELEKAISVN